jgi:acetamidase/formamidase
MAAGRVRKIGRIYWSFRERRGMAARGDHERAAGGRPFHAVRPEAFNYAWDNGIEPELEIDSGGVVEFTVRDASDEQLRSDSTSEDVTRLDFAHVSPGVAPDLMEATRQAVRAKIEHLGEVHNLSREEAYALCSVAVDLRIHEVVDAPNWVVGAFLPDDVFTGGGSG